jgi:cation diffusion facilitator CzcD-associated flavoprotein CzcO
VGCKRVLLSDDYLPALQRDNVELDTESIDRFTSTGLETSGGREIPADLVVLATGFQSTRLFGDIAVSGPDGLTVDQAWSEGIRAHRSVALKGFPNLFMMYGPNSNLGHSSILVMLEAQAAYLARVLRHAREKEADRIEVKPDAEEAWNRYIRDGLDSTVWTADCDSWYKDEAGRVFSLWPYSTRRFARDLRDAPLEEYRFDRS